MKNLLALIRPHQWLKNSFVLAGILFSHQWSNPDLLVAVALGFVTFCLASSAVYVFNDYHDRHRDARHPRKCQRPIASGRVSLSVAQALMTLLFVCALLLPVLTKQYATLALVSAYIALNIAYTLRLKRQVLIDVFCIVAGFMLRLACGTYAVGITASHWLLLCSFMLTLFLALAKRRAELGATPADALQANDSTRTVLQHYSLPLLDTLVAISASATLLMYGLYTVDANIVVQHGSQYLFTTLPIVTFGIFRYLYLLYQRGMGEEPGRDFFQDRQLRLTLLIWLTLILVLTTH